MLHLNRDDFSGKKAVSSRVSTSSTECFPLRDIAFPNQVVILRLRLKRARIREGEPEGPARVRERYGRLGGSRTPDSTGVEEQN